jgi:hypothetical protein
MAAKIRGIGGKKGGSLGSGLGEDIEHALLSRKTAASKELAAQAAAKTVTPTLSPGVLGTAAIGAGAVAVGAGAGALSKPNAPAQFGDAEITPDEIMASQAVKPGALGVVESIAAAPSNMYVLGGGFAAGWLGERIAASGAKRNISWWKKTGDVLATPKRMYSELSFGDIGANLGIKDRMGKITQPMFDGAGAVVDKVGGATGFNTWRADAHLSKATVAHQNAREIIGGMKMEHAPAAFRTHLHEMRSTVLEASHPSKINFERFSLAKKKLGEAVEASGTLSKEARALVKGAEKLGGKVEKAVYHSGQSAGWKNVRQTFHDTPKNISRATAGPSLFNASFVALSALSMANDTKTFAHNLASLRQMHKDMTGTEVSNMRLLLGTVPAPVAAARKVLIANYGLKQVFDVLNIGLNVKMHRMGPITMMAAFMGVGMLSSGVDSVMNVSVLPFYAGISNAYKQHKDISAQAYAEFLALASKDLHNRGSGDPAVMALAQQYKAQNISPVEILNRASGTQLMADLHAIIQANEAKAPKEVSHVAKLEGAPQAAMAVVGKHTEKVAAPAQTAPEIVGPRTEAVATARETAATRGVEGLGA